MARKNTAPSTGSGNGGDAGVDFIDAADAKTGLSSKGL